MRKARIEINIVASVELNGVDPEIIAGNIKAMIAHGYGMGAVTNDTEAELDLWKVTSEVKSGD